MGRLMTVQEMRDLVGKEKLSRPMAYLIAKKYGFRLGRRLVVPSHIVDRLLEGLLDLKMEDANDAKAV